MGTYQSSGNPMDGNGGYWLADIRDVSDYDDGKIRFARRDFKPNSIAKIFMGIDEKNLFKSSKVFNKTTYYEISEKHYTTFSLVHELIHAYSSDLNAALGHDKMADAAQKALQEVGIESKMTSKKDPSQYFDAALTQACAKVKL